MLIAACGVVRAEDSLPVRIDGMMEARQFSEVRPLIEQWCAELARQSGQGTVMDEARARHVLASVQDRLGEHAVAVRSFELALALYARAEAGEPERAAAWDEGGRAAQAAGDLDRAEAWLRAAAAARVNEPAMAAGSRAQLADVLLKAGRVAEAVEELHTAESLAGEDAAARWQVERQRAVLAQAGGRYADAMAALDRSLEWAGHLGPESEPLRASLHGQRGVVLFRLGRTEPAAAALRDAADYFRDRAYGGAEWLAHENNLAAVWLGSDEAVRARDRLRELLASEAAAVLRESPSMITPWLNMSTAEWRTGERAKALTALDRAHRLADAALPKVHPLHAQVAAARLAEAVASGDRTQARDHAQRASDQARAWLTRLADSADGGQLMDFRRTLDPISPLAVLGAEALEPLADVVLGTQGLALERLVSERTRSSTTRPGWKATRDSLPPGAALVNYVWWRPLEDGGRWSPQGHYGVLVLRAGRPPLWTDLGPAEAVEVRIRRLIHAARDTVTANRSARHRASLEFQSTQLWELVWSRVAPLVEGADRILLRTDGMLHFVPWAILREPGPPAGTTSGKFFCQRYASVTVIARALAAPPAPRDIRDGAWRLIAVPNPPGRGAPGPPSDDVVRPSAALWREMLTMPALPGVVREIQAIRAVAPARVSVVTPPPREADFAPPAPQPATSVIHFSGHGFARDQWEDGGVPTFEAGLVFADAAAGLRARAAGQPVDALRDGILFAREAAALDLGAAELVALSACQTGLGLWQPGGHLAGLRHAFIVAGARHVATTLWDVNDEAAPRFIASFYRRLGAGESPVAAMWSTQREWLEAPAEDSVVRAAMVGAWTVEAVGW